MREESRRGRDSQYTHHKERGRLEKKGKKTQSQKSSSDREFTEKPGKRRREVKIFMQDVLNVCNV